MNLKCFFQMIAVIGQILMFFFRDLFYLIFANLLSIFWFHFKITILFINFLLCFTYFIYYFLKLFLIVAFILNFALWYFEYYFLQHLFNFKMINFIYFQFIHFFKYHFKLLLKLFHYFIIFIIISYALIKFNLS